MCCQDDHHRDSIRGWMNGVWRGVSPSLIGWNNTIGAMQCNDSLLPIHPLINSRQQYQSTQITHRDIVVVLNGHLLYSSTYVLRHSCVGLFKLAFLSTQIGVLLSSFRTSLGCLIFFLLINIKIRFCNCCWMGIVSTFGIKGVTESLPVQLPISSLRERVHLHNVP